MKDPKTALGLIGGITPGDFKPTIAQATDAEELADAMQAVTQKLGEAVREKIDELGLYLCAREGWAPSSMVGNLYAQTLSPHENRTTNNVSGDWTRVRYVLKETMKVLYPQLEWRPVLPTADDVNMGTNTMVTIQVRYATAEGALPDDLPPSALNNDRNIDRG
jgi:hypothetical protein